MANHADASHCFGQAFTGAQGVLQQIAQHHAQIRLAHRQFLRQIQLPGKWDVLLRRRRCVVACNCVQRTISAEGRVRVNEFALILLQICAQLLHFAALRQPGNNVQVLPEIVAEAASLCHVLPQLCIATRFQFQHLVFLNQRQIAHALLCHAVELVEQQKHRHQRHQQCHNGNALHPVNQHRRRVLRHDEDDERDANSGDGADNAPHAFHLIFAQQPPQPRHSHQRVDNCQ